jgi:chaperonin GroEL
MAGALRPTLGPLARVVAMTEVLRERNRPPELLDSGGVIARRIIALPDRTEDAGAMLLRHMLCQLQERVGDGTATAAVLCEAIYHAGVKAIVSGSNPTRMRDHLERLSRDLTSALEKMAQPAEGQARLTHMALSVCHDPALAKMLGEIFSIIGAHGQLEIRAGRRKELEREYIEGMYWPGGVHSRDMLDNKTTLRAEVEEPAILVTDLEPATMDEILPVIELAVNGGVSRLVVVLRAVTPPVLHGLSLANANPAKLRVLAVKLPGLNPEDEHNALQDLSILTGATALLRIAGQKLTDVGPEHVGYARRAWATPTEFGLSGPGGDPRTLRKHIRDLQSQLSQMADDTSNSATDIDARRKLETRIGRLLGGSAVLWVGGVTERDLARRKENAARTADALRGVAREGVLPGGGAAYLACRDVLAENPAMTSPDPDERAACRALYAALAAPARTICVNAGYDPSEVAAQLEGKDAQCGFDVLSGRVVDMCEAGILDSAGVLKAALRGAIATAALALTIDAVVHHRNPEQVMNP